MTTPTQDTRSLKYRNTQYLNILDTSINNTIKMYTQDYETSITELNLNNYQLYQVLVTWNSNLNIDDDDDITTPTIELEKLAIEFHNNPNFSYHMYALIYSVEVHQDYFNDFDIDFILDFEMIDFYNNIISIDRVRTYFTTYPKIDLFKEWLCCKFLLLDHCFENNFKINQDDIFFSLEKKIFKLGKILYTENSSIW